jgi:hypothetical protein
MVGRLVDFDQSKGGVVLATQSPQNVTVCMIVDAIGEDVKSAKVGDVLLYIQVRHVNFRDGTYFAVAIDTGDNVVAHVEDLDMSRVTVQGKKPQANGDGPHASP